ncbi:MAG: hypothetical protein IPK96_07500 [Flammeovirgaceae bacterium]|nr:hypothetical protein [Flammeovirgaceae bacterium]
MHTIQFWKSWNKPYQYFFWFLSVLLIVAIGFFWYSYILTPAPVITWQYYQELQQEEIPIRFVQIGLHSLPVQADIFMISEAQLGSQLTPNLTASYIFLFSILIFILVSLTLITTLNRFWFLIGVGTFSLVLISLQIEVLEVFGLTNKIPTATILILIIALAYYFQAFRSQTSFVIRLLSLTLLFLILGAVLVQFSQVQNPLLHISVNGYTAGFILSLVFVLMIGPEIPAAFVSILTQSTRQTKSLRHFLILTGFYLLNLLLAYGINTGYLESNIWVIDFFFLFTISSVLGIWGFRQREAQYASILPADPYGIYLILSLALLSFSTMGYLLATANDVVINLLKDMVMYSHLGYGIIFLLYIISNFGSMLSKNLQVYKVLYKPTTMPYFTFRMMGLITCLAFLVLDTSWRTPINQIYAAYYNGYGDLYYTQGDSELAEGFYNKSVFYRNQNHHAHYALASIQSARLELQKERLELAEATGNPTEFAFLNLSESYLRTGNPLQSLMILKQAKEEFPTSGIVHNALGLVFSKLKISDSALLSFQEARKSRATKEMAETNLLATSAKFKLAYPADSLLQLIGSQKLGPRANTLALANLQNLPIEVEYISPADSVISVTEATFICNYFINQLYTVDTVHLAHAISLARKPVNEYFKEAILVAASQAYYAQGEVKRAFDLTREVAYSSGRGKYFSLLGMWALDQNNPQIAANYFEIAKDKNQPRALLYAAIAQTESDSLMLALPLWDSLARAGDKGNAEISKHSLAVLSASPTQIFSMPDEDKYWYVRYKINWLDTLTFWKMTKSIQQEELKARAILNFSKKWYAQDDLMTASKILEKAKGLKLADKHVYDQILMLNLMLLAETNTDLFLQQDLKKIQSLKPSFPNELVYLQSLQHEYAGRSEEARVGFEYLSTVNIHFTEGLISSAQYFSLDTTDRIKSYSILVSGLLARPNSIKLLKAYIKEAALIGFDEEANESLNKLKALLPARYFNQYIKENPNFFDIDG